MFVYSLATKSCIDITETQHAFLEKVAQTNGDINKAVGETCMSMQVLAEWKLDDKFWPMVEALGKQLAMARVLNLAYVKDQLISTIEGSKAPTKIQMAAINASIKLLQTGSAGIRTAKVEVTPDSFKVEFEEGVMDRPDANTDLNDTTQDTPGDI